jgi:uncharacterized GH25 family protein
LFDPSPLFVKRIPFFLLILLLACVRDSSAHETWLSPPAFSGPIGTTVVFDLTSGMKFPVLEYVIAPERVSAAHVRLGLEQDALTVHERGKSSLRFARVFERMGRATAWITLFPKTLELSEAKVSEYFQEISASQEVRDTWSRMRTHKWRETYTKCAKTCLVIGDGIADDSWKEPVGMALEIVPLTDPAALRVGQSASFKLLENGRPLPNLPLGLLVEGSDRRVFQVTDSEGQATFPIERAGRALFFAVHLQISDDKPEWKSNFTSFTANVAP